MIEAYVLSSNITIFENPIRTPIGYFATDERARQYAQDAKNVPVDGWKEHWSGEYRITLQDVRTQFAITKIVIDPALVALVEGQGI